MLGFRVFKSTARQSNLHEDLNIPLVGLTLALNFTTVTPLNRTVRAPTPRRKRIGCSTENISREL
jgi:hypothetical protein